LVEVVSTEIADDWLQRWREFHRPVVIGDRLTVRPPWEPDGTSSIDLVIDPGQAFGTGAHATTRLCLEMLLELPGPGGSFVDLGCGSGVLAIAAAKLGHGPVTAVDADASAVAATVANAMRNDVPVDARRVDALDGRLPEAKLALANIALDVVEPLGDRLVVDRLVTSGYLSSDFPAVSGYDRVGRRELDGWAADVHDRR